MESFSCLGITISLMYPPLYLTLFWFMTFFVFWNYKTSCNCFDVETWNIGNQNLCSWAMVTQICSIVSCLYSLRWELYFLHSQYLSWGITSRQSTILNTCQFLLVFEYSTLWLIFVSAMGWIQLLSHSVCVIKRDYAKHSRGDQGSVLVNAAGSSPEWVFYKTQLG